MKYLIKISALIILLFSSGSAVFSAQVPVSDYNACRCKQTTPSIPDQNNVCCSALALGKSPDSQWSTGLCCNGQYGGYGFDGDTRCCSYGQTWSNGSCKPVCTPSITRAYGGAYGSYNPNEYDTLAFSNNPLTNNYYPFVNMLTRLSQQYPDTCDGNYNSEYQCTEQDKQNNRQCYATIIQAPVTSASYGGDISETGCFDICSNRSRNCDTCPTYQGDNVANNFTCPTDPFQAVSCLTTTSVRNAGTTGSPIWKCKWRYASCNVQDLKFRRYLVKCCG